MNVPQINSILEVTGYQSVNGTGNPEQDAKNFADANQITVEKAKTILMNKYGKPAAAQANEVQKSITQNIDTEKVSLADDADFIDEDAASSTNSSGIKVGEEFKISYKSIKCTGNPDTDAKNFAAANNITVDEAKSILSSKFGAPGSNSNAPKIGEDMLVDYKSVKSTGDPDTDAKNFATANNISIDKAKTLLEGKYGKPPQVKSNVLENISIPPEEAAKLEELGIPKDVIKQGDDAIKKYADENNIKLPAKSEVTLTLPDEEEAAKLRKLGIPENIIQQGYDAIEKYADEHNISTDTQESNTNTKQPVTTSIPTELSTLLEAMGIPKDVMEKVASALMKYLESLGLNTTNTSTGKTQNNLSIPPEEAAKLEALGIPKDVIKQGDDAIKKYADEHNITLPKKTDAAKNETPENITIPPEEAAKLEALGIPKDVIKQGDDAIKKYADEHNITLPARTDAAKADNSSSTVGSDNSSNSNKTDNSSNANKADSASGVSSNENKLTSIKNSIKSAEQGVSNTYDRMAKSGFKLGVTQWANAINTFSACVWKLANYSNEYSSLTSRLNKLDNALKAGRLNLGKAANAIIIAYNGVKTQVDKLI